MSKEDIDQLMLLHNPPNALTIYLNKPLKDGDSARFREYLGEAAKYVGMTRIAEDIDVSRTSLYRSLSREGNASFETVLRVLDQMGLRFEVVHKERDN